MEWRIKKLLLFLLFTTPLMAQEVRLTPSIGAGGMEYATQSREYFSGQLNLKTPHLPGKEAPKEEKESKVSVKTCYQGLGGWRIEFLFPEPVTFCHEIDASGLYIVLNQSVDSPDLLKAQEKLGYLIQRFTNGFNTLYLVTERPLKYYLSSHENSLILDIFPDYNIPFAASRSLKVARARLLVEERHYLAAFNALFHVLEEYPCNKDALIVLAGLESLLPRWQQSFHILCDLHHTYPCDDEIYALLCDAYTPHTSFVQFERALKRTISFAAEQYYWLRGEQIIFSSPWNFLYLGGAYGIDSAHISEAVNSEGETVGFRGVRSQGRVYLRNEWNTGNWATALLYATEGVVLGVGAEAGILIPPIQGDFSLLLDWHRPYWELFETVAHFGKEDRFKFHINSVVNRYLNWNFEGGVHRVGIRHIPNGFSSVLASGDVFFKIFIPNPIFSLNYDLDAEYVYQRKEEVGETGNLFFPVPLESREFHTLRAFLNYQWRKYWNFTLFGGGTFNRLGRAGKTGGISIKYIKPYPRGWEVELGAFYYPSAAVINANVEMISASIKFRF